MMITAREGNIDGFAFCCKKGDEQSIRKYSFFQGSHYMMQDILVFVVEFLKQQSLKRCAEVAGIDYKKSSIDWANFIRDLFKQYVFKHYSTIKLAGEVEVDKSLFGRKVKYHRGEKVGKDVWVMGLVERASNKILVFPVEDRSEDTLLPININLNEHGFYHFMVLHKETFKKTYVDTQTGEPVEVHTNTIEGPGPI